MQDRASLATAKADSNDRSPKKPQAQKLTSPMIPLEWYDTLDLQILGVRHNDVRNGLAAPPKPSLDSFLQLATRPAWCMRMATAESWVLGNIVGHATGCQDAVTLLERAPVGVPGTAAGDAIVLETATPDVGGTDEGASNSWKPQVRPERSMRGSALRNAASMLRYERSGTCAGSRWSRRRRRGRRPIPPAS